MLSILIVNWNTREHLRRCLESIYRHPPRIEWEVIVVDNASSDGSAEMVAKDFPEVRLEASERNLGYAAGNNLAFNMARGSYLLTLNPDTEFFDDSLSKAVGTIIAKQAVGALTGKFLNPDGSHQPNIRGFPRPMSILWEISGIAKLFPNSKFFGAYRMKYFDYSRPGIAEQPMGTFILYRKEALTEVGGLDERFPIFFNEVDLLYRLHQAGWIIWYTPEVQLIHYGGESTKQVRKSMIWESHRSLIRYFLKWHVRPWNLVFFLPLFAAIYIGALVRARGWDAGFKG
jgi:GT2 family glycosyltransferase